MKDQIFLLLSALAMAALSWLFWHFLGKDAFSILLMIAVLFLLIDNVKLRRLLKSKTNVGENAG